MSTEIATSARPYARDPRESKYGRLKWITVAAPAVFFLLFDHVFKHPLLEPVLRPHSLSILVAEVAFLGLSGWGFSALVFGHIERMNAELAREKEHLDAVYRHTSDAILTLDRRRRVSGLNPAAEALTGWKADEVVGRKGCDEILGCRDTSGSLMCGSNCWGFQSLRLRKPVNYFETAMRDRNGKEVPITASCSPILTPSGEAQEFVLVVRNVSWRQRLEQELQALARIGLETSSLANLDQILHFTAERSRELLSCCLASLVLVDQSSGSRLRCIHVRTAALPVCDPERVLQSIESLISKALETGTPQFTVNGEPVSGSLAGNDGPSPEVTSHLVVPLKMGSKVLGVLYAGDSKPGCFSPRDANLLARLANQAAIAIENARLYEQVQNLAMVEERYRIAREMHDGIAQALGYLNLRARAALEHLASNDVERALTELREIRQAVKDVYADVRQSIFDLKATSVSELGLMETLAGYVEEFSRKHRVQVELSGNLELAPEFPVTTQLHLIRIVQEALTNVRKHSGASWASVKFERGPASVRIEIRDDGCGFDLDEVLYREHRRFGLSIMRERADLVGGKFEVVSSRGDGTTVRVELPVPHYAA